MKSDPAAEIERRLAALERESKEDARLITVIERLVVETGGLNDILGQVDAQQQALIKLDEKIGEVKDAAASKVDVEEARVGLLASRKRTLRRIYAVGVSVTLVMLLLGSYFVDRQNSLRDKQAQDCIQKAYGAQQVKNFTESQIAIERINKFIDEDLRVRRIASLMALEKAFPVPDCSGGTS